MYGVVATAQSAAVLLALLTEFGFNVTAVRRLSQFRAEPEKLRQVVNDVFFLKLLLLGITLLLFIAVIYLIPHFRIHSKLFLFSFLIIAGQALIPYWYYQGAEAFNKTIIPVAIGKLLSVFLIIALVKTDADAYWVNLIFGGTAVLSGILLHISIYRSHKISFRLIQWKNLRDELKGGLPIFLASISVVVYANSVLLILSFFLTPYLLGIYSIVDKIIQIFRSLLTVFHQVTYPRLCAIIQEEQTKAIAFLKQVYSAIWMLVITGCLVLFLGAPYILKYFIKDPSAIHSGVTILQQMSFICLVVSLNMPFYQILLAYRNDWLTARVQIPSAVVSLLFNLLLVPFWGISGTIVTVYLIEASVTALFMYYAWPFLRRASETL